MVADMLKKRQLLKGRLWLAVLFLSAVCSGADTKDGARGAASVNQGIESESQGIESEDQDIMSVNQDVMSVNQSVMSVNQSVMSVNQCVDQMIGSIAAEKLVSVTWFSHQPHAPLFGLLRNVPANYAAFEEVVNLDPDLVIAGEYGAVGLKSIAHKFAISWQEMPVHQNIDMFYANWLRLGRWVQREQLAMAVVSDIQRTLADLHKQLQPLNISALLVNPNGWVAGSGNFQHALLEAAGLSNIAAEKGIKGWSQLSLEQIIVWQPELIILAEAGYQGRSKATDWQRHPVFTAYKGRYPLLAIGANSLSCESKAIARYGNDLLMHLAKWLKPLPDNTEQVSLLAEPWQ